MMIPGGDFGIDWLRLPNYPVPVKFSWIWCAAIVALLPASCRKAQDDRRGELTEAGYALTADGWLRAAAAGEVEAMRRFLAAGMDPATRDEAGDTALHAAAAAGAENAARLLLDRGLEVDATGALQRTPLMAAVLGDQPLMVRWLLRQGADPAARDAEGFSPLMLAVREGHPRPVAELAGRSRPDLDSALLLAALLGHAPVIDELTSYGASVYARMDDGRTPLMLAAENGHADAVELLIDIGSSRFSTADDGRNAAQHALDAGFPEVAMLVSRGAERIELSLDAPEDIAIAMSEFVDADLSLVDEPLAPETTGESSSGGVASARLSPSPSPASAGAATPLAGAVISAPGSTPPSLPFTPQADPTPPAPPLVMRHFQERELPIQVDHIDGDTATLTIAGTTPHSVSVATGGTIPDTTLQVVRVGRRMEAGKLNFGEPIEISFVEVRDARTGQSREWLSGHPVSSHDPVALVEDAASGRRYLAMPGQRFTSADGAAFTVTDVRPNQLIITSESDGTVHTLPLRGPRG